MTLQSSSRPPYPVLTEVTDDYAATSEYSAEFLINRRIGRDITIGVRHHLASPGIRQLLDADQARYAVRITCADTRVRSLHTTATDTQTVTLDETDYLGRTDIEPLVVANGDIDNWRAPDWSPRIKGLLPEGIAIPDAALLAAGIPEHFNPDDLTTGDSIVSLVPTTKADVPPGTFEIDPDGDKIKIIARPETIAQINHFQANDNISGALWPSMYLSAIQAGIRLHRHEDYRERRWAASIHSRLVAAFGDDLPDNDDLAANELRYAQRIMDNPLTRMLAIQTNTEAES